ncbi:hypothetical protein [Methylomagnum ishizawai]|nr:hypothetical protein [Methylomagnum ishizawai]
MAATAKTAKSPFYSFCGSPSGPLAEIKAVKREPVIAELARVRAWLAHIGETDAAIVGDVLSRWLIS